MDWVDEGPRAGTVVVGGVRLAYREVGPSSGPPVLALHGLASGASTWDTLGGLLAAAGRRVVALDLRGHGGSSRPRDYSFAAMRDDVVGVLDQLEIDALDLVGHSLGGHVATLVAMRCPDRVRRLVLEDTPPPPDRTPYPQQQGFAHGPVGTALTTLGALTRLRTFDIRMAKPVIRQLRVPDPAWWAALPRLTAATMLVSGGPTSHVPPERLRRVAAAIPDARLVTIDGAGHRVHSSRPAEFTEVVVPFLS